MLFQRELNGEKELLSADYRSVIELIKKSGRFESVVKSPEFPSEWERDIEAVYKQSYQYLGPLIALFVKQINTEYSDYLKLTPIRSGQIYSKVAKLLKIPDFHDFIYPMSARDYSWKPNVEMSPQLSQWYYSDQNPFRDIRQKHVIVDWGANGTIPRMANLVREFAHKRSKTSYQPGLIDAFFLISHDESKFPCYCPRLPNPRVLTEQDEFRSETDAIFRGLLNLAETTHDRLRGLLRPRYDNDDWQIEPERTANSNVVIWALNLAAQCGIFDWVKANKPNLHNYDKEKVINNAIIWASEFNVLDFDRFTFRGWHNEHSRIPLIYH